MDPKLKKILFISNLSTIALILVGFGIWWYIFNSQFAAIENDAYGIKMKYPRGWQAVKNYEGTALAFVSPKESPMDVFKENVNVVVQDMSAHPMELKEFVDTSINQMSKVFKNIIVVESKPTKAANINAQKIVFEAQEPDQLKIMVVCFLQDNKAYIITYAARSFKYDYYYNLVDTMVKSLTISGN